jgi:hypothetical protein
MSITVKELIERLKKEDPESIIYIDSPGEECPDLMENYSSGFIDSVHRKFHINNSTIKDPCVMQKALLLKPIIL